MSDDEGHSDDGEDDDADADGMLVRTTIWCSKPYTLNHCPTCRVSHSPAMQRLVKGRHSCGIPPAGGTPSQHRR